VVRYVHLPGSAVDTALLEDGLFTKLLFALNQPLILRNSDAKRSCKPGIESEMIPRFGL
jgi:hypothetical protein